MNNSNFASLSSGLLARKGGAKPAMRPQVSMMPGDGAAAHNLEDLGWNDMGEDLDTPREATVLQLTPEPTNRAAQDEAREIARQADSELVDRETRRPVVLEQQEAIASRVAANTLSVDDHQPLDSQQASEVSRIASDGPEDRPVTENASGQTPVSASAPDKEPIDPARMKAAVRIANPRKRRSALSRGKRAAFTLRLDADRHLKLRVACTLRNKSAQQLVTDALDSLLANMPDVNTLVSQANAPE